MKLTNLSNLIKKLDALADNPLAGDIDVSSVCKEAVDIIRSITSTDIRITKVRTTVSLINRYFEQHGYEERLIRMDTSGVNYMFMCGESPDWSVVELHTKLNAFSLDEWIEIRNNMNKGVKWDLNLSK